MFKESSLKISFMDPLVIDLLMRIFVCCPERRITSKDALEHPYFDELKNAILDMKIKNGSSCPIDLKFNISPSLDFIFKHQDIDNNNARDNLSPKKCDFSYTCNIQKSISTFVSNGFISRSISMFFISLYF